MPLSTPAPKSPPTKAAPPDLPSSSAVNLPYAFFNEHTSKDYIIDAANTSDTEALVNDIDAVSGSDNPALRHLKDKIHIPAERERALRENVTKRLQDTSYQLLKLVCKDDEGVLNGMLSYGYKDSQGNKNENGQWKIDNADPDEMSYNLLSQYLRQKTEKEDGNAGVTRYLEEKQGGERVANPKHWVHERCNVQESLRGNHLGDELLGLALRRMDEAEELPVFASPQTKSIKFFKRHGFESLDNQPEFMVRMPPRFQDKK